MNRPHLFLIGYRGSGKTTVGRLAADRIGRPFHDADEWLERRVRRNIREIFQTDGEAKFRDWESLILKEISAGPAAVISCGGGVILRSENRLILKRFGFTAWLQASADELWRRISTDPTTGERRPNLTVGGIEEVRQLTEAREPLYRLAADAVVSVENRSPEQVTDDILAVWGGGSLHRDVPPSPSSSSSPTG